MAVPVHDLGDAWPRRGAGPRSRHADPGEPAVGYGEVYFQTGYDPSPAPEGKHLMSVFGQYGAVHLPRATWDARA